MLQPPTDAPDSPAMAAPAVHSDAMIERVSGSRGAYELLRSSRREGGQAEVFEARDARGAPQAVRMPHGGDVAWFRKELAAIDGVFRRNRDAATWLISVVDSGTLEDGRPFFVMPWYTSNLSEWLRRHPPLELRLRALELASRAVARLHHSGEDELDVVVHRDLKPSNFLVREEGELSVLLTDLGAARSGALFATAANTVIYTRNYAPPEQQLPIPLPADPSLDVHAMGVTIYAGLVGRIPTAVVNREALRTERGARLLTLHAHGEGRRPEEEQEFQELSRLPLGALFDLEAARALFPSDEAMLASSLCDQLAGRHPDPETLADRLVQKLLPALRRAMEPDPTRRLGDARVLQAACHHALDLLIAEGLAVGANPVTTVAPVEVPTAESRSMPTLTDARRGFPRVALLAAAALLGASLLGLTAIGWLISRKDEAPVELAAVPPTEPPGLPPTPPPIPPPVDKPPATNSGGTGANPGKDTLKPRPVVVTKPSPPGDKTPETEPPQKPAEYTGPVELLIKCHEYLTVGIDGGSEDTRRANLTQGVHNVRVYDNGIVVDQPATLIVAGARVSGPNVSETAGAFVYSCD